MKVSLARTLLVALATACSTHGAVITSDAENVRQDVGRLVVSYVDPVGHPLPAPSHLVAKRFDVDIGWRSFNAATTLIPHDQSTGDFVLNDAQPGRYVVSDEEERPKAATKLVVVESGATTHVRLVASPVAGDLAIASHSIAVHSACREMPYLDVHDRFVRLAGPGFERSLTTDPSMPTATEQAFQDLPAGVYTVHVEDPKFRHWSSGPLHPGDEVNVPLRLSVSLRLEVTTADHPHVDATDWTLAHTYEDANTSANERNLTEIELRTKPIVETAPGRNLLRFKKPGYADCVIDLDDLKSGEERVVSVCFQRGIAVTGHVTAAGTGRTLAGIQVELIPLGHEQQDRIVTNSRYWGSPWRYFRPEWVSTTEDGSFRFERVDPSRVWIVRAERTPWLLAETRLDAGASAADSASIVLSLPPAARLHGHVARHQGNPKGWIVFARPDSEPMDRNAFVSDRGVECKLDKNGQFDFGLVRAGSTIVEVWQDGNEGPRLFSHAFDLVPDSDEDRVLELRGPG